MEYLTVRTPLRSIVLVCFFLSVIVAARGSERRNSAAPTKSKERLWRLPGGIVGQPYNEAFTPTNGLTKWTVEAATIPGLTLSPSGQLSGTPTREGLYEIPFRAVDASGRLVRSKFFIGISSRADAPASESASSANKNGVTIFHACEDLEANTSYRLARDIGIDDRDTCIRLRGGHIHLDLAGHSVKGRIAGTSMDINGIVIANGTVTCNFADSETAHGCIELTGGEPARSAVEIRHLNLRQLSNTSENAARALHIDWSAPVSSLSATKPAIHLSYITATVGASKGHRSPILNVQGSSISAEYDHNILTCPVGSNACQGIVCYGLHACWMHANRIVLEPDGRIEETARALLFDDLNHRPDDFGEAWNNEITAHNGRAIRIRDAFNVWIHDNRIRAVENVPENSNYVAAIHLGDPDQGTDDLKDSRVFRNTLELGKNGVAIFARNILDIAVEGNSLTCSGGCREAVFVSVRDPLKPSDHSHLTLRNNSASPSNFSLRSYVEDHGALDLCQSGTAGGKGTIHQDSNCKQ